MKFVSKSLEDTHKITEEFLRSLQKRETAIVVAMDGDLGSGKTTFSQIIGEVLGVRENMQSPTFLIEKIYELRNQKWSHLIHIDAYRLGGGSELLSLGWREIVENPKNLILVEWANKVQEIIPKNAYHIVFSHGEGNLQNQREIEVQER